MHNLAEKLTLVIRCASIRSKFKGGWPVFWQRVAIPELHPYGDENVVVIMMVNAEEAVAMVQILTSYGLVYFQNGNAVDFVVVDQFRGPLYPAPWLNFGPVNIDGLKVRATWVTKTDGLSAPVDWKYEDSWSQLAAIGWPEMPLFEASRFEVVTCDGLYPTVTPLAAKFLAIARILDEINYLEDQADCPVHKIAALRTRLEQYRPWLIEQCLGNRAGDPNTHLVRGLVEKKLGRMEEALKTYQFVDQLIPGQTDVLVLIANCAIELRDFPEVARVAKQATRLEPQRPAVWALLAIGLSALGQEEEATAALGRAKALDTENLTVPIDKDKQ